MQFKQEPEKKFVQNRKANKKSEDESEELPAYDEARKLSGKILLS